MKHIVLITFFTILISCEEKKGNEILTSKLIKLEKENQKLKDSIFNLNEKFIYSQVLHGTPETMILKTGKKNKIFMKKHKYYTIIIN